MRARRIGRTLGIGVRIAARVAGARVNQTAAVVSASPSTSSAAPRGGSGVQNRAAAELSPSVPTQSAPSINRGIQGFVRPFRRVGGILWLEVTGVFFLLPVVVFTPTLWRNIVIYRHTGDHKTLWLTGAIIMVFLYLGIGSFWRAHRRAKQDD